MKLLNWMRTRRQNGLDPSKDFKGGFGCLRAQISSDVQDIRTNSFSFSGPSHDKNLPKFEEKLRFDEDGFCGFLAIGTLGTDPETPKFSATFAEEDVSGEKKEMAKLITEKLDKYLKECPEDISSKPVERSNAKEDKARNDDEDSKPKKKDLIRKSAQTNRRKVHPVLYTPIRDHNEIDDRRKVDLKVHSLTGGFLGASSTSDANRKREKWIKTDAEYLVLEL
ncbi:PREDICTED: protein LAZY 1-like [Camelina sativa]|uniref:Protein LAZY 1-like n=1 Tax=Camelina sativa TaxID=90675 RepID=A0ABM0YWS2_CAMSA|nr:PREDICTED: protein LAZY 1-like [Camelina sativa]